MTWKLSSNSKNNSAGIDPRLVEIRDRALQISSVDFGHPPMAGARTFLDQKVLYDNGKSQCDGIIKVSKHQVGGKTKRKKAKALDFFAFVDGKSTWEPKYLTLVAMAFMKAANELGYELDWGGFWIDDGGLYGWDCGHVELVE